MWYDVKTNTPNKKEYGKLNNQCFSDFVRQIIFCTFKFSYAIITDIATPDIVLQFKYQFSEKVIRHLPTYVRIRLLKEDRLLLRRQIVNYIIRN